MIDESERCVGYLHTADRSCANRGTQANVDGRLICEVHAEIERLRLSSAVVARLWLEVGNSAVPTPVHVPKRLEVALDELAEGIAQ